MLRVRKIIGVVGSGAASEDVCRLAMEVGRRIAEGGGVVLCGGLSGVMEAAARGAVEAGGLTVGILPGHSPEEANPYIEIPIVTGMGNARNVIVAGTPSAIIALEGGWGTLSEIALARKMGVPVIALGRDSSPEGVLRAGSPEEAVAMAFEY